MPAEVTLRNFQLKKKKKRMVLSLTAKKLSAETQLLESQKRPYRFY